MRIESIKVENFRNIHSAEVLLPSRLNVFLGDNGAGKTSLLEAAHIVLTGRSQRRATNEVMLRKGADYFRVAANLTLGKASVVSEYGYSPGRQRSIKINNNPVRGLSELLNEFAVVSFAPEDLQLVTGTPAGRRRAIDFLLSTASAGYLTRLTDYSRAIQQKNKLLKDLQKSGPHGSDRDQLHSFNAQIIELGVELMRARSAYSREIASSLHDIYAELSDEAETVSAEYTPSVVEEDESKWAEAFERQIEENEEKERILAVAVVGPHRDDWELTLANRPARQHASQGQARSLAVAMKLAGFRYLESMRGDTPVLLFDEIFGELDPGRGKRLLKIVGKFAQALITSVQPATIEQLGEDASCFNIVEGAIESVPESDTRGH